MHRKNTISEHLRDLLDVYPEVNISGIGLFSIIDKAAWIDISNNDLYPPTKTLSIRSESLNAVELITEVSKQLQNDPEGLKTLREKLNAYVAELNHTGTCRIDGVGVINRESQDHLTLVDVHPQWGEGTAYLPVIEIFPVSHLTEALEPADKSVVVDISDQKDLLEEVTYQEIGKQSLLPLIVLGLGVISFLWFFRGCDPSQPQDENKIEVPERNEVLSNESSPSLNLKYADYLTPEIKAQGCKIVVGSYSQRINAESQLNEVSAAGYIVEMSQNDNSYRVVIVFNCNDYNLKDYLARVRDEISTNAWYLSPSIKSEDL